MRVREESQGKEGRKEEGSGRRQRGRGNGEERGEGKDEEYRIRIVKNGERGEGR